MADPDGAELVGWIDGSQLKLFFTPKESVHSASEICMPNTTQEEESEEL